MGGQGLVLVIHVCVIEKHVANGAASTGAIARTALLDGRAGVVHRDRGIVGTMDGDRELANVGEATLIAHRVIERFAQRVARTEGIDDGVGVVHHIGVGSVGVDGEGAVGTGEQEAAGPIGTSSRARTFNGTGADGRNGAIGGGGVTKVDVRVIGEHIAAADAAGRAVRHAARL